MLPYVLNLHDPERPYIPSSPYIDSIAFSSGTDNTPEKHLWGPRDYFKSDFYTKSKAKFASETGYHGCPAPASIEKFIDKDHLWPHENNQQWLVHATCMEKGFDVTYAYRIPLMAKQIGVLFKEEPQNLTDFASMTYAYYHANVKPKPQPAKQESWVCKICGYVHESPDLPADFICPLCGHGAEDFELLS